MPKILTIAFFEAECRAKSQQLLWSRLQDLKSRAAVKSGNFAKAALELQLNPLPLAESEI